MGIVSIEWFGSNVALGLWQITESVEVLNAGLRLSDVDINRLSAIKSDRRKKEWLACRNLLGAMTDTNFQITYDSIGKPLIENSDWHISMSHSGDYACVYLKKTNPCGVDIQILKKSLSKGMGFFINENEKKWIDSNDNSQMHLIWSAKEAAIKYTGNREIDFKNNIELDPIPCNQNESIQLTIVDTKTVIKIRLGYRFFNDHVLVWTL
jgi:4'-phosphopantetheinyl transferase